MSAAERVNEGEFPMHSGRWTSVSRKIAHILFAGFLVSALGAQVTERQISIGFPDDWTNHRIKFSTAALHQRLDITSREPRAALQLYREAMASLHPNLPSEATASFASSSPHADWSANFGAAARLALGMYPAKWNSDPLKPITIANCNTDYVVFALNVVGATGGQANMVALNNLYSGAPPALCSGGQPKILFAYNVSTVANGKIATSPVLSLDGTKVAFLETVNITGSHNTIFHVLNIPATNTGQQFPPSSGALAPPAGAMTSLSVGAQSDSRSSPWVDYPSDSAYFATDNGRLWKVHPVFTGTPALVATAPWPIVIHQGTGSVMTSPTLDVTGNVFIGAANGVLYSVNVNSATPVVTSLQVGAASGLNTGILDAPLLDSTGGSVFAISSNDSTSAVVVQANTSNLAVKSKVRIGQGSAGGTSVNLYDGDFDNNFTTPSSGHLLVCGTGAADPTPWRYNLPFDGSGNLAGDGSPVQLSTDNAARCGPVTEFFNANVGGGTDFLFWSVTRSCLSGRNGCVMSLVNGAPGPNSPQVSGGASGIIVDNNSNAGQASSIYFSTESAPYNAVKLTQQNLN
jgi:hypothetical protein